MASQQAFKQENGTTEAESANNALADRSVFQNTVGMTQQQLVAFQLDQVTISESLLKLAERQMSTEKTADKVMADLENALQNLQNQQMVLAAEESNAKQVVQTQNESIQKVHESAQRRGQQMKEEIQTAMSNVGGQFVASRENGSRGKHITHGFGEYNSRGKYARARR